VDNCVKFKYQDEAYIYPKLLNAANALCAAKNKGCTCTSGYRSLAKQKIINADSLQSHKGAYQTANGAVYTPDGKCWAAAYGASNHCFCIAMDITDEWFKTLTNTELKRYGLIKPMDYELWHVQLLEHQGLSLTQKEAIRDSVLKGEDMTVKEFQAVMGLTVDGVVGTQTKTKAKEVLQCCQEILGLNFSTAEETIKSCMSSPATWLTWLESTKYADSFVMNIVNKMGGKK
jgi:murein L,D-transpeptidase YcbB/YkuD